MRGGGHEGDRRSLYTTNTRDMTPADGSHQQQRRSPIQQLLSPQQSAQSDLIGTAWLPDGSEYAPGYLTSRANLHPGHNTPVSASPRAPTPQEQQQWGQSSRPRQQQQQQHQAQQLQQDRSLQSHALQAFDSLQTVESASSSMASGSQDRSQSRNSSPVRRRLAEVMVLEAKAAAAAVLRSPNDSGTRSMCSSPADTGRMVEQQRVLERPYSPTRSVKGSDTQVTICAGVVGTALPPRSPTPTEGSIASSNGFGPAGPGMTHARASSALSGRVTPLGHQISISPQSSVGQSPQHASRGMQAQHSTRLQQLQQQQQQQQYSLYEQGSSSSSALLPQGQQSISAGQELQGQGWCASPAEPAVAAATAAFGMNSCTMPAEQYSLASDGTDYYDTQSRGSNGGPAHELSFAATASPAWTDGGSESYGANPAQHMAAQGRQARKPAAGFTRTDSSFTMQPLMASQVHSSSDSSSSSSVSSSRGQGSSPASGPLRSKKSGPFKFCFLQTDSATASPAASGAGAADGAGAHGGHMGHMGCGGHSHAAAGQMSGSFSAQAQAPAHTAGVHGGHGGDCVGCNRGSCFADDHSFCSAESVAPTSWSGSCADTDRYLGSFSGAAGQQQQFPLQALPPPPLWASPLFPPPEGYLPVGADVQDSDTHAHFAQRVKMLRMQAAAVESGAEGPGCAEAAGAAESSSSCGMQAQGGQHRMVQSPMQEECSWQDDDMDTGADSAQLEMYSVPLRAQHAAHKPLAQQGCDTEQQAGREQQQTLQEPGFNTGLSVKVKKGGSWAGDSPSAPAYGAIKALFEVSKPLASKPNPFATPAAHHMQASHMEPVVLMYAGVHRGSESASEGGYSNTSAAAAAPRPASANGKLQNSLDPSWTGYNPAAAAATGHDTAGREPAGHSTVTGGASGGNGFSWGLPEGTSSDPQAQPSSPHRPLQVTAVPGSALYTKKTPDGRGGSPRFAPARFPPSPRRGASCSTPPSPAAAAAALANAKADAASAAAEKAQTAADAAAAEARATAARAAAARVYKASAAAAAAAVTDGTADGTENVSTVRVVTNVASTIADLQAAGPIASPKGASAKAAMHQARKAAHAAAEATAAAVAAEATAVEAATAAVVAALAEEQASRAGSRAASPYGTSQEVVASSAVQTKPSAQQQPAAPAPAAAAAEVATPQAATDPAAPAAVAAAAAASEPKAPAAEQGSTDKAAAPLTPTLDSTAAAGDVSAASSNASSTADKAAVVNAAGTTAAPVLSVTAAQSPVGGKAGSTKAAAKQAIKGTSRSTGSTTGAKGKSGGLAPASRTASSTGKAAAAAAVQISTSRTWKEASAGPQDKSQGQGNINSSSSSSASRAVSPKRVTRVGSSSTSGGAGAKTPRSYAAMSAAKLSKFPSSPNPAAKSALHSSSSSPIPELSAQAAAAMNSSSSNGATRAIEGSLGDAAAAGGGGAGTGIKLPLVAAGMVTGDAAASSTCKNPSSLQSPRAIASGLMKAFKKFASQSNVDSSSSSRSSDSTGSKLQAEGSSTGADLAKQDSQADSTQQSTQQSNQQSAEQSDEQSNEQSAEQQQRMESPRTSEADPAQGTAAGLEAVPEGGVAEVPIEDRILFKQQQLMHILHTLKGVRSRSTSPNGRASGSRNATPRRSNSRGPSPGRASSAPRSQYVGMPLIGRTDISPSSTRSRSVSPRQRAASPEALAQLAVPAYRKQTAAAAQVLLEAPEISANTAESLKQALRAKSPERMVRPGQAAAGSGKAENSAVRNNSSPKQKPTASTQPGVPRPLPRVATLLHAADAATSASAAVRAASPPKQGTAAQRAAGKGAAASNRIAATTGRKAGPPAAVKAAAAQSAAAMAAALAAGGMGPAGSKVNTRTVSPLRQAGSNRAAAAAGAGRHMTPPRARGAALGSRDKQAAAKTDEKAAKVVTTLIALDNLMPASSNSSSSAAAGSSNMAGLRSAAEALLRNLQSGAPVSQDALAAIMHGAQRLSEQGNNLAAGAAGAASSGRAGSEAPAPAAAAATAAAAGVAAAPVGGNGQASSAKLHALAQQLAALCQDMGANMHTGGTTSSEATKSNIAAAAATEAAATAAVAAAAAMEAAQRQQQRKMQAALQSPASTPHAPPAAVGREFPGSACPSVEATGPTAAAAAAAVAPAPMPAVAAGPHYAPVIKPAAPGLSGVPMAAPVAPVVPPLWTKTPQAHSSSNSSSSSAMVSTNPAVHQVPMPQFPPAAAASVKPAAPAAAASPTAPAAAAAAGPTAAPAAAAAVARRAVKLGSCTPRSPRRQQPLAQKLLRMVAAGRKGMTSKCHRMPSVAGSSSGGGSSCQTPTRGPRVLTASAAASLPRSSLGLTPVAARKANVLKPKGWVSKHSSFRLLTPWLVFRPALGSAVKASSLFYTQAFRASLGGPDEAAAGPGKAAAGRPRLFSNPGLSMAAGSAAKQLQKGASNVGKALNAGVTQGSEALKKLLRSSSGMSLMSLKGGSCYFATGEVNADAADEETAGTAAPAISAADHKHAHQMLTGPEGATQLGTVPEGDDGEGEGPGGAAGGRLGDRLCSANGRERLTAGKMPKAPPMMSRSAYLQYLKQQSHLRRLKAQQCLQHPQSDCDGAVAASVCMRVSSSMRQSTSASRRVSRDPTSQGLAVVADPATAKVASAISSILMLASAGSAPAAAAAAGGSAAVPAEQAGQESTSRGHSGTAAAGDAEPTSLAAAGQPKIHPWGSGLGFASDPHWSEVAEAARAADAVLASSKEHASQAASAAAAAANVPTNSTSVVPRVTEQSQQGTHSTAGASDCSSHSGAAAAAAAAAAVAAMSAAAAAAEAKAAAAAANNLMGSLLYAERSGSTVYANEGCEQQQQQQQQQQQHRRQQQLYSAEHASRGFQQQQQHHHHHQQQLSAAAHGPQSQLRHPNQQQQEHREEQAFWQQQLQQQPMVAEDSTDSALLPKDKRPVRVCPRAASSAVGSYVSSYDGSSGPSEDELLRLQLLEQQQQAQWEDEQLRLKEQLLLEEEVRRAAAQQGPLHAPQEGHMPRVMPKQRHVQEPQGWGAGGDDSLHRQLMLEHQRQQLQLQQEQQLLLEQQLEQRQAMLQNWDKEQQELLHHYHLQQKIWADHCRQQQQRFLQEQETAWAEECRRQQKRRHRVSRRQRPSYASDTSTAAVSDCTYTYSLASSPRAGEKSYEQQQYNVHGQHAVKTPSPLSGKSRPGRSAAAAAAVERP